MPPRPTRLATHPLAALAVLWLGWGFFGGLFGGGDRAAEIALEAPSASETQQALVRRVQGGQGLHAGTLALYQARGGAPLWTGEAARALLRDRLARAPLDGLRPEDTHADRLARLDDALARAQAALEAHAEAAREAELPPPADPRPALLAERDALLTDAALRYAHALLGRRVDPARLYPGTWFPHRAGSEAEADAAQPLATALAAGDARAVALALDGLVPQHAAYRRLARRYAELHEAAGVWVPIPEGAPLTPGEHSIRVPHLRGRLAVLGYLGPAADPSGWSAPDPYALDAALAAALARFRAAHALAADSLLDDAATAALNMPPDRLLATLALNLERWRWQPPVYEDDFVFVNLPAFELRVFQRDGDLPDGPRYAERLRMPANIGNAATTGWTTPVIRDSIPQVIFQPEWYVPASLAASVVFPLARRDSLALHRSGYEVWQRGAKVDSRLVPWDSVSVSDFRFMQRPGPANPLGRVKFPLTNPYAILIHDTNKPWTLDGERGGSLSSGCVQAGDPEGLAAYLLGRRNGWEDARARQAYRRGPRLGVNLERPFPVHFVYFTAWVDETGALRLYPDVYGYDARLASALGLSLEEAEADAPAARPGEVPLTMRAG